DKMAYESLRVADVMSSSVITCSSEDDTKDVCDTLMQKNIRHIPVAVNNKLIMLLSMKDFLKFPALQ
ncbi:MAG: CBS domain-containing protein, partial [Pseudomonadota bacterium]